MVEANSSSNQDQTLAFFDAVFNVVPPVYRRIEADDIANSGELGGSEGMNKVNGHGKK